MNPIIGLLGGVASGKSTVAKILSRRGFVVLDADAEARDVVASPDVLRALSTRFGAEIVASDGTLDRAALAQQAFASAEATADLNAIVHPAVRERLRAGLAASQERPVVLDVPLLLGSPFAEQVDVWVFVESRATDRDQRTTEVRGWDEGERDRREQRQASLDEKRARADHVLENFGSMNDLERNVDALLARLGLNDSRSSE